MHVCAWKGGKTTGRCTIDVPTPASDEELRPVVAGAVVAGAVVAGAVVSLKVVAGFTEVFGGAVDSTSVDPEA